jgi:hypothetical protein
LGGAAEAIEAGGSWRLETAVSGVPALPGWALRTQPGAAGRRRKPVATCGQVC